YRAVSTREIAEAVGVTQPALYHHFAGKEELYVAVLEEELAQQSAAMWQAARLDTSGSERLAALAESIAVRAEYDLSLMFHDLRFEVSEVTRRRIGLAFRDAMMMPMAAILETLVEEGKIAPMEEAELSQGDAVMYVLGVIRTLTDRGASRGSGSSRSATDIGAMTVRLVLHGLGGRD
ncbi:MAG: TetR/AcrR family transcriptional regulator, partial [Chloroflexota bacterium]|nr:TetR/AcrR family transcriptional regulator [Chloroflexota bacterium]